MAVVFNAKGTSVSSFQIGKQGPLIKNNGGIVEFRNSADTDYVEVKAGGGATPTSDESLTTKLYVDNLITGLDVKESVRVATLASSDIDTDYTYNNANDDNSTATPLIWTRTGPGANFDGVTLSDGDRVLIKNATDARGDGIFTFVADTGGGDSGFRRAYDTDNTPNNEVSGGMFTFIEEGSQADSGWVLSSINGNATLGTDSLGFTQFSGGGGSGISNVLEDTTPQLGGDLDVNGNSIVSVSNGNIPITPNGSGTIILDGLIWPSSDGTNGQVLTTDGSGNLTFQSTAGSDDQTASEVPFTPAGTISSTDVQSALEELDSDIQAFVDTDDQTASEVPFTPSGTISSTNVQSALEELDTTVSAITPGITNVVEDTTPQLGGDLDANGFDIQFDDATGIKDDSDNEQLIFQKTTSAVNYLEITNSATGNGPELSANGDDTNVDLLVTPKGAGNLILDGLNWPTTDGSTLQFLQTDGSGNLSFATALINIVEDTSPQLGGDLDVNGFDIVSVSGGDINLVPDSGGEVIVGTPGDGTIVADNNSDMNIGSGDSDGTADAGDMNITSGDGFSSFASGDIYLTPGSGGSIDGSVIIDGLIWPSSDGTNGQVLITDGSGNLSFATASIDVVGDTTPQLGGDLDVNGNSIVSTSNGNITLNPDGTGVVDINGYEITKRQTATIDDNQSSEVTIASYTGTDYESVWIDYVILRSTDGKDMGTLQILNDGTSVSSTNTQTSIGTSGVTLTASISVGTISFEYTSTSTGNAGTIAYTIRRMNG